MNQDASYPKNREPVWPLISKIAQEHNFHLTLLKTDSGDEIEVFSKNFSFTVKIP